VPTVRERLSSPVAHKISGWESTVVLFCVATAIAAPAQTFTNLLSFDGSDGASPLYVSLVQGTDGNLYGTTQAGGANGVGTVFKITPLGALNTLHSFDTADGASPYAGLVQASDGNFYGTTEAGGAGGVGTVYKITSGGTLTTLHSFCAQTGCTDGSEPTSALVQGTDGNLYGTTYAGGSNGKGTVFKITTLGVLTTLYSFSGADGTNPYAGLVQASNGNFYGTTYFGGAAGLGTIFRITAGGILTTLYSFSGSDGSGPLAGLIQAANGSFYGTTGFGGANSYGTVFGITSSGMLNTLHSFDNTDGANPYGALVQTTDGNFYGTTSLGGGLTCNGGFGCGEIFKITAAGVLTALHTLDGSDGASPRGGLAQDTSGSFYGTTCGCGIGDGTVFSLAVGLGPFVETRPSAGKVGAHVIILGSNLTGATSVTFNGTAAAFTVVSASEIRTTVPSGATSGKVKVTTPGGVLVSNVAFRVVP
jgi:uncharacterized repeat protein (TIGR03803 family)